MKKILALSIVVALNGVAFAQDDVQTQIDALTKEIKKLKKDQYRTKKTLIAVKKATGGDNVKFSIDFRNAVDSLEYRDDTTGQTTRNPSLITSKLHLNIAATPMKGLIFKGKLAIYSTWGSHLYVQDSPLKDWSASSKPADSVMRVKEAYFLYSDKMGTQPYAFSVGRRPSTNGFLANYRENEKKSGSPLAHITNMEVNAAMFMLKLDRFVEGSYSKFVYGRAHTGEMENVYGTTSLPWGPYAETNAIDDESVDFFIVLGNAYNDGQYQLAYQWSHIFDTKGLRVSDGLTKAASGSAELAALSLKVSGIGDEINDFLDDSVLFASIAATQYNAKDGYSLLGPTDGGSQTGYSYWAGAIVPDGITKSGKFGIEYNHGSKYWTPMTWAEDSAMGSKIAVRGSVYEAYWNFDLFGVKHLPSQVRYTYAQHDYTPNVSCAGWITPVEEKITASDVRVSVSYRY